MGTSYIVATAHTVDSFNKGVDSRGPYINVQYYINSYSDVDRFINALVGAGTLTGPITGGTTIRNSPHQHPLSTNLFCTCASLVAGLGAPTTSSNGYPDFAGGALVAAEYRPLAWDAISANANNSIDPSTSILYCTQSLDFTTETFTIADNTFKFVSSSAITGVPAKYSIPVTELVLTFHQLPYMPMATVRSLRGKVNNATFLGATAGTVLFRGAKSEREFNQDGTVVQKLQLMFSERSTLHPWNSLPSRTTLVWGAVTEDGTGGGTKMYETADLSPLVQF